MTEGDVVMLKSGGPPMTITSVRDVQTTGSVFCRWFDDGNVSHGQKFKLSGLKLAIEPPNND